MHLEDIVSEAQAFLNSGDLPRAIEAYQRAISKFPRDANLHYQLAIAYQRQGTISEAISRVDMAIQLRPQAVFFNFLGACYLYRNEPSAAELCFRRAMQLDPKFPDPYNNLGLSLLNLKRYQDAGTVLKEALQLAPTDVNLLCNVARVELETGHAERALDLFDQAHALQPSNVNPIVGKVATLGKLNRNVEALALTDLIAQLDPSRAAEALHQRAVLLGILGDLEGSCAAFDQALLHSPQSLPIACARAHVRKIKKDETFFAQLIALEPMLDTVKGKLRSELAFALGKAYQDVGDIQAAAKFYATGGANVLQYMEYDQDNEIELYAITQRNISRQYLESVRGQGHVTDRPIFILGMERSGTTLVEQLLASHPDVYPAGELKFLEYALSGFVFPDGTRVTDLSETPLGSKLTLEQRAKIYLDQLDALPGSRGKLRVTDKMPGNFKSIGLICALFPNAHIIHCRRDPVDTCISSYTQLFAEGNQWSFDLTLLGQHYRRYWNMMAHWRRELPGRFLEVRYEQVVENTELAARELLEWCGLPWDEKVLRFYETDRPVNTASVAQVRQPIYTSSMGRWKKWEPYIQPLLNEIRDIEDAYWAEPGAAAPTPAT